MRLLPILLIGIALATAGCFGNDDENGGEPPTTTTPTGTPTPPTGATPTATPTSPTPGEEEPTQPAPREVFSGNANFQVPPNPDPGAPNPVQANPFSVPAGYTTMTLNVTWALGSPAAVAGPDVSITVVDAAGTTIATCAGPGAGPVQAAPAPCTQTGTIPATAGDYSADYHGSAPGLTATVQVVVS